MKMRKIFKNQKFKSLLATINPLQLETRIIQMDFILANGVLTFWDDTEFFVAYRQDLGLIVPGLYTYWIDDTSLMLHFWTILKLITTLNIWRVRNSTPPTGLPN